MISLWTIMMRKAYFIKKNKMIEKYLEKLRLEMKESQGFDKVFAWYMLTHLQEFLEDERDIEDKIENDYSSDEE